MAEPLPPPIYSQQADESPRDTSSTSDLALDPQILIIPSSDAINFQKGYLGAEEERAAIEGEIQIKGAESGQWARVQVVSLRTLETAFHREIELGFSEVELFSSFDAVDTIVPSSFLFAIPLMEDTPQSLRTPHSSISHTLTATLHPLDASSSAVSKTLVVHTRRYTAHSHSLVVSPETHTLEEPTRVEVQVPRTTFKAGELIPLYVTVPAPPRELVLDRGLRLRNVRVELMRIVEVNRDGEKSDYDEGSSSSGHSTAGSGPSIAATPPSSDKPHSSSSKAPVSPLFPGSSFKSVIARSGASCRFHSSRPVQLRFILHQPSPSGSPSEFQINLPSQEYGQLDSDAECASITQLTLLHSITFQLHVHISFVDMSSRTERISTISIPVVILAPPAPLPEMAPSMEAAYSKKHDRPPAKTVRHEDPDFSVPHYSEGEAGPSVFPGGAPPPFEERDAPPPFFSSAAEASTSSRLPTFLESETEIIIPPDDSDSVLHPPDAPPAIAGEGYDFGFSAAQQFDGHSDDMQRSSTPPPTLEMASRDANLTPLAAIHEPERAIEVLGLVLDQHEESSRGAGGGELPPPPPALDDPSDPPPSIDSDFRSPNATPHPPSPPSLATYAPSEPGGLIPPPPDPSSGETQTSDGHAPPPYLVPGDHPHRQEHVARPPPYVD
ncbi:hypothetical protein C8F04DRAFT_1251885 [Mycena alexandri]|uniref:Uncharacterized protein n=1 Tax=Mycena alexandri TaxID=1745969 RepID=A0AAD6X7Y9_9AGAR|nr:hypothetical protein C8F04DRAFT_1251885 [Mycena alexandri]